MEPVTTVSNECMLDRNYVKERISVLACVNCDDLELFLLMIIRLA